MEENIHEQYFKLYGRPKTVQIFATEEDRQRAEQLFQAEKHLWSIRQPREAAPEVPKEIPRIKTYTPENLQAMEYLYRLIQSNLDNYKF